MTIDSAWNRVVHAVAVNEHRSGFHVRSIFNANDNKNRSNRLERGFMGAHSDIGGGYAEGDLSDVSLMWIINEAKKAGIKFTEKDNEGEPISTIPRKYKRAVFVNIVVTFLRTRRLSSYQLILALLTDLKSLA